MNSPFDPQAVAQTCDQSTSQLTHFANAQLVLPDRVITGRLSIHNGLITDIAESDAVADDAIDCRGAFIVPGLIELHTDNLERHIEPRPAVDWPHLAALVAHDRELASTGITTVFDALRVGSTTKPNARNRPYARRLADELLEGRAKGFFKISHFLHLRAEICSETLREEMAQFGPDDRVGIVSLMDHTPGQRQFHDLAALKVYWTKKRSFSDDEFAEHVARLKELQRQNGAVHEAIVVVEAARYGATLASHDDTTAKQVAVSEKNGVRFAEFPTTVEAAEACRARGIAIMMGAPNIVRGASHSRNVSAQMLARADLLDIVSSDYVPSALLLSACRLADIWQDLPRAIACVTQTPAQVTGLDDRGSLQTGKRADIVRFSVQDGVPLINGVWSAGRRVA